MALLNSTPQSYYQSNSYGNYQFVSLADIIDQFMFVYVGEDKIIPKARRTDVAFHAQRALAELSFDTFKSCKSQEITLPPSLQMILPHDYVNYTKVSWVDSAGIKHLLYPTSKTSNPTSISQDEDGNYVFGEDVEKLVNADFSDVFADPWFKSKISPLYDSFNGVFAEDFVRKTPLNQFGFTHNIAHLTGSSMNKSKVYAIWQEIDTSGVSTIEFSAKGSAQATTTNISGGTLRIGISLEDPTLYNNNYYSGPNTSELLNPSIWAQPNSSAQAYLEWKNGESDVTKSLSGLDAVNVSSVNKAWVLVTSTVDFITPFSTVQIAAFDAQNLATHQTYSGINSIDDIVVTSPSAGQLTINTPGSSTTWTSYKSATSSENQDDYQDDTYWPMNGSRYGLDPQHAQANGSFYIDCASGKIHFSSNISGKTVILDYISDSLGTDGEMQVHKFAEDAMYKWMSHAIMAGRANVPEYQVNRFKKERFAAIRTAKLRLSNLKLEELTQILRGKSKQIKH
tara:strand:- start:5347 stop:6876 length:1530 start_codon:yes stop_codon:yes gene_type:complete